MDASFVITWKELLIAGIIVLAVYIAELLLLMSSGKSTGLRFWRRRAENKELAELKNRLAALEIRLARLEESGDSADTVGEIASNSYGKAFSLAKQGMDVAQVAATCGISRSEAELIVAMQRNHLH
ncbi:MAG: DUF2802 domain-containing protein [Hydrogenophilales bacterium]|nr:DUF2802 domain-containing protein [Hydrogenophilales bacterium]